MNLKIRDRIKEFRRVPASELIPNPKNYRKHSAKQREALRAVLSEVGFAGACLARESKDKKLHLIDGHLRKEESGKNELLPVLVLDVTEKEADKILASFDPLSAMAQTDFSALKDLVGKLTFKTDGFKSFVNTMSLRDGLEIPEAPGSVKKNAAHLAEIRKQRKKGTDNVISKSDTEKYLIIVFPSREAKEDKLASMGLPYDERYIAADAVELVVVGSPSLPDNGRRLKSAKRNRAGAHG